MDTEIVDELNFFLETPDGISGFSLVALNLTRGLDHGLDIHISVRAQLIGDIDPSTIDPLDFSIITSNDVFQMDLWFGGLAEDANAGTQMGPLFTHIITDQFMRTRAADETSGDLDPVLGEATIMGDMAHVGGNVMTGRNDDTVVLSGRAIIDGELCTGRGTDDITIGARATVSGTVNSGKGDDVIRVETGANITDTHGGKGFDTLQPDGNARVEYDANPYNRTIFYLDDDGNDTGKSFDFRSIERITCFTSGTLIITERDKLAIETLKVGDRVWTLNHGLQPIDWVDRATVPAKGALAPILIRKGAMDNTRDLLVSQQHRMMLDGWRVEMHCGVDEVLTPAKALCNDSTIRSVEGGNVTYVHIAFDAHEIVMAEGIPSESFFPGAEALAALDHAARSEILTLFPEWRCPAHRPVAARQVITAREAKALN